MSQAKIDRDHDDTPAQTECPMCQKPFVQIPGVFRPVRTCHCLTEKQRTEYFALNMAEAEKAYNLIQQAKKAISAAGHKQECNFRGCTCKSVEQFKIESGEFWRQVQAMESRWKVKP